MNKLFINIVLTLILISKGTEGIVKIIICDSICDVNRHIRKPAMFSTTIWMLFGKIMYF